VADERLEAGVQRLHWRRQGWAQLFVVGALAGLLLAIVSLNQGLGRGLEANLQALETGQAQLNSAGGIGPYFMVRAAVEQNRGVLASSARLDFRARLVGPGGLTAEVEIRACNYDQEDKVTGVLARIERPGRYPTSGIVLSRRLSQDPRWKALTSVRLLTDVAGRPGVVVPVSGFVTIPVAPVLENQSFMDLETAFAVLGTSVPVSSIAVKLRPSIDAVGWVAENQKAFSPGTLTLRSWKDLVRERPGEPSKVRSAVSLALGVAAGLVGLGIVLIGWRGRPQRSGLSLLLRAEPRNRWRALGLLVVALVATDLVVFAAEPLYRKAVLGWFQGTYPFAGTPILPWSFDLSLLLWPFLAVTASFLAFSAKPRPRHRASPLSGRRLLP
jgi:hypothetical protein